MPLKDSGVYYSRDEYVRAYSIATTDRRRRLNRRRYLRNKFKLIQRRAKHCKWQIQWNKEHRSSVQEYRLKRIYGITLKDYEALVNKQDNSCAICGKSPKQEGKALSVDHCHKTGKVRGLLCTNCNTVCGRLEDNPKLFERAHNYLNGYLRSS